ncbi:MAG: alanine racemase, partial [Lachnospiraceae bacterium]|nr:alanine racemase [Lachnospiraceae bacterium]
HKKFCDMQKDRFDEIKAKLSLEGVHFDISHIANSGGTVFGRYEGTNMIRPGNLFFGLPVQSKAQDKIKIKPVLGFYTSVAFIKYIDKGQYISYGMSYRTTKKTKVATIQVGFGDGYKRALSNKQDVYINGKRCRIIGRVSMDQTMVDVTNVDCKIGDKVELIGPHISIVEVAKNAGTCYTDVYINITKRVERIIL